MSSSTPETTTSPATNNMSTATRTNHPKLTTRRAFPTQSLPEITYGAPFAYLLPCHLATNPNFPSSISNIYIIASSTLARTTSHLEDLEATLGGDVAVGGKVAGVRVGMKSHTFISEVLEIVQDAGKVEGGVDLIVTMGGGSLTDAGKIVALALGNNVRTEADLMALPFSTNPDVKANPPACPVICIPTSLSGGEYSDWAGVTRDSDHQKFQFSAPLKGPRLIILDAELALATPSGVWLASGVRSIDHCVETFCGLKRDEMNDDACVKGLQRLVPALLVSAGEPENVQARHEALLGVNYAMYCLYRKVLPGASHGIGHMLGPLGVAHGHTSAILLPSVCKYNAKEGANAERQNMLTKVFWEIEVAKKLFESKGLKEEEADLGDLIDVLFKELGMPRTLREVGVEKEKFEALAVNSLEDSCTKSNPAPLKTKEQILEILEMCA